MLQEDRYVYIIEHLKKRGTATFAELARVVDASMGTVRRDLQNLEKSGMLQVIRGGAIIKNSDLAQQSFDIRTIDHREEKTALSEVLGGLISEGQTVALNSGTTNIETAKYLAENYSRLTVITNNLRILHALKAARGFTVIVPGGILDHQEHTIYGRQCEEDILSYHIDTALLSVNAISLEKGITDFRLWEAGVIQALIKTAKRRIIVADHSKFDRISCMKVCGFEEIDCIVSDSQTPEKLVEKYAQARVKVITPGSRQVTR